MLSVGLEVVMYFHVPFAFLIYLFVVVNFMGIYTNVVVCKTFSLVQQYA